MKHLILLLISFCSCNLSPAQLNPAQNADAGLYRKNKVKSIKVYTYRNKQMRGKGKLTSYTNLDTLGRETEEWSLLKLGFFMSTEYLVKYRYNENQDVSEQISFVIKHSDPLVTTYTYRYDDQQRVTYKKENNMSGDVWKHTYDTSGKLVRTQWYLSGEEKENTFFFIDSFDYSGNVQTGMRRYQPDHSLYFHFTYEYDQQGNRTKETRHEKGRITDTWLRTYDEKGNCIQLIHKDHLSDEETTSKSEFDAKGLRINAGKKGKFVYEYY